MIAPAPPPAALVEAVRGSRWAEVRDAAAALPRPLAPTVALAAARAARELGEPRRALELLRGALPRSGDLAAALRLEGGRAALAAGTDPWPWVAPLLGHRVPQAQRHAAAAVLGAAWEAMPVALVRRVPRRTLPFELRRRLAVTLAVRSGDAPAALRIIRERTGDPAALRAAVWLAGREPSAAAERLDVAEALLAGGAWREADTLLARGSPPARLHSRWAFLRGRAAYRLGDMTRAAAAFADALATAANDRERFAAAVQRARVAEIGGAFDDALRMWDTARAAAPREVEGWDGGARARALLGRGDEAAAILARAPAAVRRTAGPRLAALLLARGDAGPARRVLASLPPRLPAVRALTVAALVRAGDAPAARAVAATALADPGTGAWREMILGLLPPPPPAFAPAAAARDPGTLAAIAVAHGAPAAAAALAAALAGDPEWAPLLTGEASEPPTWSGPARELAAAGLERDAAELFAAAFPAETPSDLAWSDRHLAAWGNRPAALTAGERLWRRLGGVPAAFLPAALQRLVLPPDLVGACRDAAHAQGVPAAWLVGIVRQESRFDEDASSPAGAIGVAQMVPEAARSLGARPEDLADARTALRLAAREVSRLEARFGARLAVVAAAYNAGDRVVATWLGELGGDPGEALFAAAVPYRETAGYVLAVCEGAALAGYLGDGTVATGAGAAAGTTGRSAPER